MTLRNPLVVTITCTIETKSIYQETEEIYKAQRELMLVNEKSRRTYGIFQRLDWPNETRPFSRATTGNSLAR